MDRKLVFSVKDVKEKLAHNGAVIARILVDGETCGATKFSFLINTMKANLNCDFTGLGHKHNEEHCLFGLSGTGGVSIDGTKYPMGPNTIAFVPPGAMHYVWADPSGDFTYVVVYAPPGPEKEL